MNTILQSFNKIAENEGISLTKLEHNIGASKGVLSRAIANNSDIQAKWIMSLVENYPQYDVEWVVTGKGPMLKADRSTQSGESIPLIPVEAMAGFSNGNASQIMEYDTERYVIPEFSELKVEFLIRMKGSSMLPKYNSGDILGCKRLPMDTFFQWNKVYVLDTVQGALVKRIHKSDMPGHVTCVSDNPSYPPYDLNYDVEVNAIAIVLGVIRLE